MTDRPRTTTKTVREQLDTVLSERVIVLDGAMGTMLQRRELQEEDFRGQRFTDHSHDLKGNFDVLVLTKPSLIAEIHAAFFNAGADIVETDTFNANAIVQADYGLESFVYELNCEATKIAKQVAKDWNHRTPDRPRFVAGAIGPTN